MLLGASGLGAAEWNQYHGVNSDKKAQEDLTSASWLNKGSSQVWKTATPLGFSSFSVAGGRAFTLIGRTDEDGVKWTPFEESPHQTGWEALRRV